MIRRDRVTAFATVGADLVAYEVAGSGPELLYIPSVNGSHVDARTGYDPANAWYRELSTFARTISLDRRGLGASDPPSGAFTWRSWVDDVVAVLDDASVTRSAVLAANDSVPVALLLATAHPERVSSIICINPMLAPQQDPAYLRHMDEAFEAWGRDDGAAPFSPTASALEVSTLRRLQRMVASPGTAERLWRNVLRGIDARELLPSIAVPVTVLHRPAAPIGEQAVRDMKSGIRDVRLVSLPGKTPFLHEESGAIVEAIRQAMADGHGLGLTARRLGTVLFADIVGSTAAAWAAGDHAWRTRLDTHDLIVESIVELHGGRVVNAAGDGFLAIFDEPLRALRAATSLVSASDALPLRIGIHTGEIEWRGDDVSGIGVHVGARIGALAAENEILVSRTVRELVSGSGMRFLPRGQHSLKGLDEEWEIHAVDG